MGIREQRRSRGEWCFLRGRRGGGGKEGVVHVGQPLIEEVSERNEENR
jgi:hypothetical protein